MTEFVLNAQSPVGNRPRLSVTAAIIRKDGRILLCQRPEGKNCALLWEFPGGKIEPGEQAEACVIRECREELDVMLRVIRRYGEVVCDYPDRTVNLQFFVCEIAQGEPRRKEHAALAWAHPQELAGYSFCPADAKMLREYGIVDALRT